MSSGRIIPWIALQFTDQNGAPYAGGKLFSYAAGTTTPQATYTDQSLNTPNTNPVVLDSAGRASVFIGPGAFKFLLEDASGNVIWTRDNVVYPDNVPSVSLTSQVTGVLPEANGGTNQSSYAKGDTLYSSAANTLSKLSGNTAATKKFLTQTGDGTNSAAPAWGAIQAADVPTLNQSTTGTAANITATSNSTLTSLPSLSLPGSQVSGNISGNAANVTGVVGIPNGGTGQSTQQSAINALTGTQSAGKYLRSDGTNAALSSIQAADVPTLNQNTTGTAANVTGTVAIANGGTGQTTANAALNALLPSQTSKANRVLKTDGANTSWGIAAGGGTKNYLAAVTTSYGSNTGNGDFEFGNTSGWGLGHISALTNGLPSGTPTFGSGASGNLSISAVTGGSQIAGSFSLSYGSSAATTAGDMLHSDAFYIDQEDQGKILNYSFYYLVAVPGTGMNFSKTSSNSFGIAAYDVTNSSWLQVSNPFGMNQVGGVAGPISGYFQTNPTTTQIRFIVYNANATTSSLTLELDDFVVGPAPVNNVIAPISSKLNTLSSTSITANTALTFTINEYDYTGSLSSLNKYTCPQSGLYSVSAHISQTTSAGAFLYVAKNGSFSVTPSNQFGGIHSAADGSGSVLIQCNAGDTLQLAADTTITVANTNANVSFTLIQSAGTGPAGQVVAAKMNTLSSTSVTANTALTFTTTEFDTNGALSLFNKFTCPVSGEYLITMASYTTASGSAIFYVAKNGSFSQAAGNMLGIVENSAQGGGSTIIQCNADDTLQIASNATVTMGATLANVSFSLLQGPSSQTSTPTVAASYRFVGNTAVPASTTETLTSTYATYTKIKDSQNIFNTSTGVATIQTSGTYRASLRATISPVTANNGNFQVYINQAGSNTTSANAVIPFGTQFGTSITVTDDFVCNAGDTLTFQVSQSNSTNSIALDSSASRNSISIERVGN